MTIHYNTVHKTAADMDKVALTCYRFGYSIQDSIRLSKQIRSNLDSYLMHYERAMERQRRLADSALQNPTQTPFWKARNG